MAKRDFCVLQDESYSNGKYQVQHRHQGAGQGRTLGDQNKDETKTALSWISYLVNTLFLSNEIIYKK